MTDFDSKTTEQSPTSFPVVALCASAGGLNAFEGFFNALPNQNDMAFIVVQHLAAHHESILPELIARHTKMPVLAIEDATRVEPNRVYVLPELYEVRIRVGVLYLTQRPEVHGWPKTIDNLLQSLADDCGEAATAVIFSGTGTDSLAGAQAIKAEGGLVIAQDLATSVQPTMPSNIINAGLADAILPPGKIPEYLINHYAITVPHKLKFEELTETITEEDLKKIVRRLRRQTGRDFSEYKPISLQRQITRRMGIYQLNSIEAYLKYMDNEPEEARELIKYLLIHVTSFFRDPEAFESLKSNAILPQLQKLDIDTVFRVWVPGCASGEESVSIAILIHECLRERDMEEMEVRIFATDTNRDLVQQARTGIYPLSIVDEISAARLQDNFIRTNEGYQTRNHISRMMIWSEHNLAEHPPFSKLHLISCRNVLIYFQRPLQERILSLFQFALNPHGILFLGSSETLLNQTEAFTEIDSQNKIYQRLEYANNSWTKLESPLFINTPRDTERYMPDDRDRKRSMDDHEIEIIKQMLVEYYKSTCVLVDEQYHVRYTYGEIDHYLRIVPGREGQHSILDMAREGLDVELTVALHQSFEQDETVIREGVWVKSNGDERIINLIVEPVKNNTLGGRQVLLIFELAVADKSLQTVHESPDGEEGVIIKRLREELLQAKKALQNVTQSLQANTEELTSSMEEIRSANEEVLTTNEELRTSKEELESMNEELNMLNTQLADQNHELNHANNTLHNFLQSTEIAVIFLDLDLAVREYTSAANTLFGLRRSDVGRPLAEIVSQLAYTDLIADAQQVLDTLHNIEKEVHASGERWYSVIIRPYRTINNIVDGLVLTFMDITYQKQAQETVQKQFNYVQQIFDTLNDSIIELDAELRVINANPVFYATFAVKEADTVGTLLYDLGNGQWDIPELRRLMNEILPEQSIVRDYTVTHDFPDIGLRTMRLNARQIADLDRILLLITDVSENGHNVEAE